MAALTVPLPAEIARDVAGDAEATEAAVDAAVRLLRSPGLSEWPVDTGRSKRAWRRLGSGLSSRVFNPLNYASIVERRTRAAQKTLRRNVANLRAAVKKVRQGSKRRLRDLLGAAQARPAAASLDLLHLTSPGRRGDGGLFDDDRPFVEGARFERRSALASVETIRAAASRRRREERRRHVLDRFVENLERQGGRAGAQGSRRVPDLEIPEALKRLDRQTRRRVR